MNDLTVALLAIAALVLLALYIYSKWQERRALQRLDASLRAGVGDALLDSAVPVPPAPMYDEPVIKQPPLAVPAAVSATAPNSGERIEPKLGKHEPPATLSKHPEPVLLDVGVRSRLAALAEGWVEDPLLDWVLELRCAHPVDGVAVIDAAGVLMRPDVRQDNALPALLVAWDQRRQQWCAPDRFGFYSELLVATQLANRRKAMDDIVASQFVAAAQQIAVALDADFDPPDVQRMVEQAKSLDQLCSQFDVQIGLTLVSEVGPWKAEQVDAAAQALGFAKRAPMRWLRLTDSGAPLCSLSSASLVADRLVLELDVPLAPPSAEPLRALIDMADRLATQLSARVVDDNGRAINAASVNAIEAQLQTMYGQMRAAGIEPGDTRARRLFAQI